MPAADARASIEATYRQRTRRSESLHRDAQRLLPSGVARGITYYAPYPTYVAEGCGCRITDVDGNVYVDQLNNFGSMIHGHAHPAIVAAVREQVGKGTDWGAPTPQQVALARLIADRVPSIERIRFTNSGTEAVMHAVRAARAFTGRNRILRMEGSYHGGFDSVVTSPGISAHAVAETLVAPFNDLETASGVIRAYGKELAAVLAEPVAVRGLIAAEPGFLRGLRDVAREAGVLFICDEVVTFRLAAGGAQEMFGIAPDLTTFGKIIGGGLPVGAFGGRADIMDRFDPTRPDSVLHSGTFAGNAATMVAGVAALELLTPAEIARVNALGERLRAGIRAALDGAGVPGRVTGLGSLVGVHLADRAAMHWLHLATLNHGLFMRAEGAFFVSTAMQAADVAETLVMFGEALADAKPTFSTGLPS